MALSITLTVEPHGVPGVSKDIGSLKIVPLGGDIGTRRYRVEFLEQHKEFALFFHLYDVPSELTSWQLVQLALQRAASRNRLFDKVEEEFGVCDVS